MIDLCAEKGYLKTTLNIILLMQMIMQGKWHTQSILDNIPYFTPQFVKEFKHKYLFELMELNSSGKLEKTL